MATETKACEFCGATESIAICRSRETGVTIRVEEWYRVEERRTGKLAGWQCVACWEDMGDMLAS